MAENIQLKSNDGALFEVDRSVIRLCTTLNGFEDIGRLDEPIPIQTVNGSILQKVIEWCQQHKDDPPLTDENMKRNERRPGDIPAWDQEFLKVDQGTLFELISAANYLNVRGLLDVCCKTVADMLKGMTPEEIRRTFGIKNDFSPEEQEKIRKENAWCEG